MATKEERELRQNLKDLTRSFLVLLARLDVVMKQPQSPERGKAIARICNDMDVANDCAMRFGLGLNFGQIERLKKAAEVQERG